MGHRMIRQVRHLIASSLDGAEWPVYDYKPDDITQLPCVVVDRPTIAVDVQWYTATVPIVVIGLRDGSEGSQTDLDDMASAIAGMLAGPDLAVNSIEPATATVAEMTYPAYQITVSCGITYCQS